MSFIAFFGFDAFGLRIPIGCFVRVIDEITLVRRNCDPPLTGIMARLAISTTSKARIVATSEIKRLTDLVLVREAVAITNFSVDSE